jgi:hypothetical protein
MSTVTVHPVSCRGGKMFRRRELTICAAGTLRGRRGRVGSEAGEARSPPAARAVGAGRHRVSAAANSFAWADAGRRPAVARTSPVIGQHLPERVNPPLGQRTLSRADALCEQGFNRKRPRRPTHVGDFEVAERRSFGRAPGLVGGDGAARRSFRMTDRGGGRVCEGSDVHRIVGSRRNRPVREGGLRVVVAANSFASATRPADSRPRTFALSHSRTIFPP